MDIDLDLKNYNINELENLFGLSEKYDLLDVNNKQLKLQKKLLNSTSINETLRRQIIEFITNAKDIIIARIKKLRVNEKKETYELTYETMNPLVQVDDHFIQNRQETIFLTSNPSNFVAGKMNPLRNRIIRQTLNIDSRFRENYYGNISSNYHYDLPLLIKNVVSLQLASMDFPCTFYNINKAFNNNFFTIIIDNTSFSVTVPDGNYTPDDFINCINNILSTAPGLFKYIYFTLDISNGVSGTGKIIVGIRDNYINTNLNTTFNFTLDFIKDINGLENKSTPLPLKLGWILGFRNGVYTDNSTYTSEGIIDLLAHRYIYLVVNDYNNNVNDGFYASFTDSVLNKNILARIAITGGGFNIISQNNLGLITYPRQYFGPVNIQKLQIQLLDEYGRILDLNNMDYSICLTMETIYDL
jgi:hypothetical protein